MNSVGELVYNVVDGLGRPRIEREARESVDGILRPLRNVNRTIALLLLSLAAVNMPQTVVLCVGDDGHVAIEPAGHYHGADGIHFYGPAGLRAADHSHVDDGHGPTCVDIPIPVGTSQVRNGAPRSKSITTAVTFFHPSVGAAAEDRCTLGCVSFRLKSPFDPILYSTVLLV